MQQNMPVRIKIPYLGLCLGMQVAIIEFARNVCGFNDAHSIELDPNTTHPVIALDAGSGRCRGYRWYFKTWRISLCTGQGFQSLRCLRRVQIHERHRHRYEVNNDYRNALTEKG